jgi:uncharacterized protein (TIGR02145 family)
MTELLGGTTGAGGAMKSTLPLWNTPNTGATNSSGFSGLPGGHAFEGTSPATFYSLGDASQFATTTMIKSGTGSFVWILSASDARTGATLSASNNANSCRCVKDP